MTINYPTTTPRSVRIRLDNVLLSDAPLDYFIRRADTLLDMAESIDMCADERDPYIPQSEEMATLMDLGWSWENPVGISNLISALEACISALMTEHGLSIKDEEPAPLETEWLVENGCLDEEGFTTFTVADEIYEVAKVCRHTRSVLLQKFIDEEGLNALYNHWYN